MRSQTIEPIDQRAAHVHFEHAGLHQREQAVQVLDRDDLAPLAVDHRAQFLLGQAGGGMLLEEALALGSVGTAHQRERPVDHVRRHPVPHRAIVVRQILLGDADIDPIDAVGMGEAHVAFFPGLARTQAWRRAGAPPAAAFAFDFFAMTFVAFAATLAACARSSGVLARLSSTAGSSRTTSFAGLSSRTPLKAA